MKPLGSPPPQVEVESVGAQLDEALLPRTMPGFALPRERSRPLHLPPWFIDRCRQAYLSVDFGDLAEGNRILGITAPLHSDGKTFIGLGIATAMAIDTGEPTLTLECDFASETGIAEIFEVNPSPGLSEWIEGSSRLRLTQVGGLENAFAIVSGGAREDAARLTYQLLDSEIVEQLRRRFKNIVIDLPPVVDIGYSALASRLADRILLVARYGVTGLDELQKAVFLLGAERVSGVVLNCYDPKAPGWFRRLMRTDWRR